METAVLNASDPRKDVIVIPKVLVTLQGENVQRGIARILIQEFHKLLRTIDRQHAQDQGVNEAEDGRVGADAESQR